MVTTNLCGAKKRGCILRYFCAWFGSVCGFWGCGKQVVDFMVCMCKKNSSLASIVFANIEVKIGQSLYGRVTFLFKT